MAGRQRHDADARLAAALARGAKVEDAAREAGFSARTAFRRLQEPGFRAVVTEAHTRLVRAVAYRAAGAGEAAIDALVALLADQDPKVKRPAAQAVLDYMLRARDEVLVADALEDMRRRLEALEGRHDEGDAGRGGAGQAPGQNGTPAEGGPGPAPGRA